MSGSFRWWGNPTNRNATLYRKEQAELQLGCQVKVKKTWISIPEKYLESKNSKQKLYLYNVASFIKEFVELPEDMDIKRVDILR